MEERDEGARWWQCAYYQYLDGDRRWDLADEDDARERARTSLQDTVAEFVEGKWNLGTLKYRMDEASADSVHVFPPRSISATLQDLALSVPLDDLEPALRRAAALPADPGDAKGALMDLEEFMDREVSRGHLPRSQARAERWVELAACLWHIQDPLSWPPYSPAGGRCLRLRGETDTDDYGEYASAMRRLADVTGASMVELEHLLTVLDEGLVVPSMESCSSDHQGRADAAFAEGRTDEALELYERILALKPRTPSALMHKAELYESKGLIMAAIGEMESLVELEPLDLAAHRKLLALYKANKMIREHNIEVRRYKALREGTK